MIFARNKFVIIESKDPIEYSFGSRNIEMNSDKRKKNNNNIRISFRVDIRPMCQTSAPKKNGGKK